MHLTLPSQAHNLHTMRTFPLAEISGSLGDLGTLLPLLIALTLTNSINLSTTLVFTGLANTLTGVFFSIPLPVQPMKTIATVAISREFSKPETASAGLFVAGVVAVLSVTGLLNWIGRVCPSQPSRVYRLLGPDSCLICRLIPAADAGLDHSERDG